MYATLGKTQILFDIDQYRNPKIGWYAYEVEVTLHTSQKPGTPAELRVSYNCAHPNTNDIVYIDININEINDPYHTSIKPWLPGEHNKLSPVTNMDQVKTAVQEIIDQSVY
jgi:hypothetical protein